MHIVATVLALVLAGNAFADDAVFSVGATWRSAPGAAGALAVEVAVDEGWHVNSDRPLDEYLVPTQVSVELPQGWKAGAPAFPQPRTARFEFSETPVAVFEAAFTVTVPLYRTAGAARPETISGWVLAQACNDTSCLAPTRVGFTVPVGEVSEASAPAPSAGSAASSGLGSRFLEGSLLLQLALVFVAGLALNLTPCVFPLIQITIGFFLAQKGGRGWLLALTYGAGVVLTYSALGAAAAATGSLFGSALQSPWMIGILVAALLALAASMFGAWELRVPQWATRASGGREGHAGAFVMGLIAGVVAAPCIGPFVFGLLTYVGQRQDLGLGIVMFFVLGLGLALPYVVLASSTGLLEKLPNAGLWMVGVRQVFGVLLVVLAAYFARPVLPPAVGSWLEAGLRIAGGLYLLVIARPGHDVPSVDRLMRVLSAAILVAGILTLPGRSGGHQELAWQPYDAAAAERALANGGPIVMDFYADWCLPCKELDEKTFSDPEVAARLAAYGRFKVDLTRSDPATEAIRRRFDIAGVPTVAFFKAGAEVAAARLTGFEAKDGFLRRLDLVEASR